MICKACNHIRDVDLCRDSHLLTDGKQVYVSTDFSVIEFIEMSFISSHQWSSAVQQVFDILSLCLHPSLSSAACLSAT